MLHITSVLHVAYVAQSRLIALKRKPMLMMIGQTANGTVGYSKA